MAVQVNKLNITLEIQMQNAQQFRKEIIKDEHQVMHTFLQYYTKRKFNILKKHNYYYFTFITLIYYVK